MRTLRAADLPPDPARARRAARRARPAAPRGPSTPRCGRPERSPRSPPACRATRERAGDRAAETTAGISTGAYTTTDRTAGYRAASDRRVKWLLQIARSGGTRRASRSVQWRPVMTSCAQNTSGRPARRTTPPKIAWLHGAWQTTRSNERLLMTAASALRAPAAVCGFRSDTVPRWCTAAPAVSSSVASRPSKQSANSCSPPGPPRRAMAARIDSIPPKRLPL